MPDERQKGRLFVYYSKHSIKVTVDLPNGSWDFDGTMSRD